MRSSHITLVALLLMPRLACAGLESKAEGPCLPLHTIEGMSGHFSVPSAYPVNAAPEGEVLGLPSVGVTGVHLGHGKHLEAFAVTETLWDRVALGGLDAIAGLDDNDGVDVTLYASKMFTFLPRPLVATLGVRSTESAHIGLIGFTGDRTLNVEAAVCYNATDELVLAAEYRQKPDEYTEVPGLLNGENDWWVLAAAYLISPQASIAVGYGHFGMLLNHDANSSWGIAFKFEF